MPLTSRLRVLLIAIAVTWFPASALALNGEAAPHEPAAQSNFEWEQQIDRGMRLQLAGRNTLLVSSGLMVTAFAVGVATPLTEDERRQDLRRGVAYSAAGASIALLIPSITLLVRGRKIIQRVEAERGIDAMFAPTIHRGGAGASFYLRY